MKRVSLLLLALVTVIGMYAGALYLSLGLGINDQVGLSDAYVYLTSWFSQACNLSGEVFSMELSDDIRAILDVRFLRGVVALISGGAFALSGVALQGSLRNPLTDAGILGIGSGAVFVILFCIVVLGISTPLLYSFGAMLGALVVAGIVLLIVSRNTFTRQPASMVIIGAAISAVLSAVNHALTLHGGWRIQGYLRWTIGVCTNASAQEVFYATCLLIAVAALLFTQARNLDMIQMGDDAASALGVPVVRTRFLVCVASALSCALGVVLAGPLPFLGLMVPHMVRSCGVTTHGKLLTISYIAGGILTLIADTAGRLVFAYFEIPAGVVLAIVGFITLCIIVNRKGLYVSC